ncbi:MAG: glycosyltransferase [Lachnospiraceae bacterium]|nr:glycosyltransferase [Lachnospiraceae bacterium]
MKIVLVNTICQKGSIGRICADLYEVLDRQGHEPYMAAGRGKLPAYMRGNVIGNKADFTGHVLKNFFQGEAGFGSRGVTKAFIRKLEEIKPDLIHLHNIHGFYLQVEELFSWLKKSDIPVVWTLHDCWPFTGHCAYFDFISCDKWKKTSEGCHDCPLHRKAYPYALFKDNSRASYARKAEAFTGVKNLTIVTPSKWLADMVKESFLSEYPTEVIPNGIDLELFKPLDSKAQKLRNKQQAGYRHRTVLGVANYWEERKGLSYLERLSDSLPSNYTVEVVGLNKPQVTMIRKRHPSGRLLAMERTANPELLAALYRTADVYVNPTLEDNFPTTNLEALACGTPVITFETGGSGESLTPDCGLVVPKGDFDSLLAAVTRTCEERPFSIQACRSRAEGFSREGAAEKYVELYRKIGYTKETESAT